MPSGRLHLLVIGDDLYATHPLPETGAVAIGRSTVCQVVIDHPSISRRHAVLHLGPPLAIVDQGSSNGTRVRDVRLEMNQRAELAPGDLIELGALQLVIQRRSAPVRRRRVLSHDYFDARLEEECERCELTGACCAVLHLRADATRGPAIEDALAAQLRTLDIVGSYAPGQYEALLCEATAVETAAVERRLITALAARDIEVDVGIAYYPDDGRSPDAIIGRAAERARGEDHRAAPAAIPETGMETLRRLVERIAQANISVLVQGETGVGKEVIADTIHNMSLRAHQPLLRINCAALSETLLESELFGHEKGAFTGAIAAKPGLLETAHNGTVFLDEIGELPSSMQVKLLRVIEDRRVLRVGGLKSKAIDVRFIAATNRDLEVEVERGAFRQDLYFRLNGITLTIPPLRERQSEIAPLVELFVARACAEAGRSTLALSPDSSSLLHRYSWPGNIRELKHMMERAVLLCQGELIKPEHLPVEKLRTTRTVSSRPFPPIAPMSTRQPPATERSDRAPPTDRGVDSTVAEPRAQDTELDFHKHKRERERAQIIAALKTTEGNQSKAAEMLGISRRTLSTKLDLHNLPRPRKRL